MRCLTCGEELREGAKFCPTCGTQTGAASPSGSAAPPTVRVVRPSDPMAARADETLISNPPANQPPARTVFEPAPTSSPPPARDPAAGYPPIDGRDPVAARPAQPARDPGAGYDPTGPSYSPSGRAAPAAGGAAGVPGLGPVGAADFGALGQRLLRLAKLDTSVFGEFYSDASATIPVAAFAALVLLISGLGGMLYIANGVGFDLYGRFAHSAGTFFLLSVVVGTILALVLLAAWAGVTQFLLKQFGGAQADFLGIARVLAVSIAPLALTILLVITDLYPSLAYLMLGAVAALALIGILESVDVKPGHAWVATIVGFAVFVIALTLLGRHESDLAPGFFAIG